MTPTDLTAIASEIGIVRDVAARRHVGGNDAAEREHRLMLARLDDWRARILASLPREAPPARTVTINGIDYQQMTDIVLDAQGLTRDHLPVPPPPVEDMPDDTCGVCGIERAVAYHQTVPGEQDAGCCYDSFGHRWQRRKET